jgi:hypothetical protein
LPVLPVSADDVAQPHPMAAHRVGAVMVWPDDPDARRRAEISAQADLTLMEPEIRAARERLVRDGAIAGFVLSDFLGWRSLSPRRAQLDRIKKEVAPRFGVSKSTVENTCWKKFRHVAHLWAARIIVVTDCRDLGVSCTFPCSADDLPQFLAVAEVYRKEGEAARPTQSSKGTVLKAGETWRVAPEIELSMIVIKTERKSSLKPVREDSDLSNHE